MQKHLHAKALRGRRRGRTVAAMKMIPYLFAALALLFSVGSASADETADKSEILRGEKASAAALVAHDTRALAELLSADWRIVTADGSVMTREALFKVLGDGTLKFESYSMTDLDVRVYGDAAVVIGHGKSKMVWEGETSEGTEIFTDVFIRRDGKWQCVSTQSCDLPEADAK